MDFKFGAGLSVDYVKPDGGCFASSAADTLIPCAGPGSHSGRVQAWRIAALATLCKKDGRFLGWCPRTNGNQVADVIRLMS